MLEVMEDLVTVFRSADESARDDASAIAEMLTSEGIAATVLDDDAPGVLEGVWEVRVAAADSERADQLIAARQAPQDPFLNPDGSHALDLVTVMSAADGSTESESEALTVKALLAANGIDSMIAGQGDQFPSLGWEVRVAREQEMEARQIIALARANGPDAADEAEAETEG